MAYFAVPSLLHAANSALFSPDIRKEEYQIATKCVLVLNADSYTAWNFRKMFVAITPQNLRDELKFTAFILTKHPKSIETWVQRCVFKTRKSKCFDFHTKKCVEFSSRRWILERLVILEGHDALSTDEFAEEKRVVYQALQRHRRNYYAWRHMTWILARTKFADLLQEWKDISRFCREYPSDHSAATFKAALLEIIVNLASKQDCYNSPSPGMFGFADKFTWDTVQVKLESALLASSLIQSTWMIETFPGHESTWQARRGVISALLKRPQSRALWFSKTSTIPLVAEIDYISQIDEVVSLLGQLIITNSHSHAWSGRTPVSDEASDSDREALYNSAGLDSSTENLRGAVQICGLLDVEIPSFPHSLSSEIDWAKSQASRNEEAEPLVKQHLSWLETVMVRSSHVRPRKTVLQSHNSTYV